MARVRYDGAVYEVDDDSGLGLLTKLDKVIESGRMRNVSLRTADGGIVSFLLSRSIPVLVEFPVADDQLSSQFRRFVTQADPESTPLGLPFR